jgi:hypothetical protein
MLLLNPVIKTFNSRGNDQFALSSSLIPKNPQSLWEKKGRKKTEDVYLNSAIS